MENYKLSCDYCQAIISEAKTYGDGEHKGYYELLKVPETNKEGDFMDAHEYMKNKSMAFCSILCLKKNVMIQFEEETKKNGD